MTPKHDYEAALINYNNHYVGKEDSDAIRHALRVAKALQDGPSEGVKGVAAEFVWGLSEEQVGDGVFEFHLKDAADIYTAMRDQLYREVE